MPHETSHQNKTRNQDSPSHVSRIWRETQSRLEELFHTGEPAVLKAAPGSGKTTASFRVARENQQQLTYLAARHDMYTEAKEKALEAGFDSQDIAIIPSPHTDCPTFRGDHGSKKREQWRKLYQLGINADALHYRFTAPCEPGCPYLEKRIDDPDDYDVIIGHYVHGRDTEKIADRLTVVDEFPGSAYTTSFSTRPSDTMTISEAVNGYFAVTDDIPWDNYGDFVANINKEPAWKISGNIQYHGFRAAESDIVELNPDKRYHRLAPLIIFALHNAANVDGEWTDWDALDDFCNDWHYFNTDEFFAAYPPKERMRWGVPGSAIIIRKEGDSLEQEELHVLQPVDLSPAEQVIGLDGTARKRLWDTIFTQEFRVKEYIANERMTEYVTEVQEINLAITGAGTKPYSSGNYVSPNTDATVTLWTRITHGKPLLITPKKAGIALKQEEPAMFEEDIGPVPSGETEFMTYGMVESNDDAAGADAIHICGSPHPGDEIIKQWGAFMGESVERQDGTKGVNLTYEPKEIGEIIHAHFVHDRITQAILRGRKSSPTDDGAFVIVNTRAVPDWFTPSTDLNARRDTSFNSADRRSIVRYLLRNGETTTSELEAEEEINPQTARECLNDLEDDRLVTSTDQPGPKPTIHKWDV